MHPEVAEYDLNLLRWCETGVYQHVEGGGAGLIKSPPASFSVAGIAGIIRIPPWLMANA